MEKGSSRMDKRRSVLIGGVKGAVCGISFAILLAILISIGIVNAVLPEKTVQVCSAVIMMMSSFVGALIARNNSEHNKLLAGICVGALLVLIQVILAAVMFGVEKERIITIMLPVLCGCILPAFFNGKYKRREKQRNYRFPNG